MQKTRLVSQITIGLVMFINLLELMNWNNLVVEGLSQFQTIMLIIILKILIFALFKKKIFLQNTSCVDIALQ